MNTVFIEDTWPALAWNSTQAPDEDADDSFEEKFSARIAGVHLASASSSAQSVDSVEVPPKTRVPQRRLDNADAPKVLRIVGATQ